MTEQERNVLLGVLGSPEGGNRIGFEDGEWILATGDEGTYEVLARHANWSQFMELVGEYTDYIGGEREG